MVPLLARLALSTVGFTDLPVTKLGHFYDTVDALRMVDQLGCAAPSAAAAAAAAGLWHLSAAL